MVLVQQGSGSSQAASMQQFPHAQTFNQLSKGDVFFVPCDTAMQVKAADAEGLLLWIASVNASVFETGAVFQPAAKPQLANGQAQHQVHVTA